VLFNEPKLLKYSSANDPRYNSLRFSALQRAEIAEMLRLCQYVKRWMNVSVLFNEPKLLKSLLATAHGSACLGFSALQRAEIAEIVTQQVRRSGVAQRFSALQRAEIAEIKRVLRSSQGYIKFQCSSTSRNC